MKRRAAIATFAVAVLVLILHARTYLPFISDDSFISLRYADRLLAGHGLTWTDGERVEGYSNLLWILLSAALGRLGVNLITAVRLLGVAAMAAAMLAIVWAFPPRARSGVLPALTACLAFALSAPVAIWAVGGLEQPLVAALLGWAVAFLFPFLDTKDVRLGDMLGPGFLLGLLCLTRPDGPIFTVGACAGFALARRRGGYDLRAVLGLAVLPAMFVLGQLMFRRAYYGEWVPNSAFAKIGFTGQRLLQGVSYVGAGARWLLPLLAGAAGSWLVTGNDPSARRRAVLLAVLLTTWSLYVAVIGGDIFPGRRHLVPIVLLLSFMVAEAVRQWELRVSAGRLRWAAAGLLFVLLVAQSVDPESARARSERWEWDGEVVGRFLGRAFGELRPLFAVDPAGCVPYFSGLPAIDMLGLNDRYLAHHPPHAIGLGWLGHELGDGDYVLRRQPDLVLMCGPRGSVRGCFASGQQMLANPRFLADYFPVTFEGDQPYTLQSRIWVRREGGRLGVQREPGRVIVPGWLLAANPASVVRLGPHGRPGMSASGPSPAYSLILPLPPGRWKVLVEGSSPQYDLRVVDWDRSRLIATEVDDLSFTVDGASPKKVGFAVAPFPDTTALVYRVVFERQGGDSASMSMR